MKTKENNRNLIQKLSHKKVALSSIHHKTRLQRKKQKNDLYVRVDIMTLCFASINICLIDFFWSCIYILLCIFVPNVDAILYDAAKTDQRLCSNTYTFYNRHGIVSYENLGWMYWRVCVCVQCIYIYIYKYPFQCIQRFYIPQNTGRCMYTVDVDVAVLINICGEYIPWMQTKYEKEKK